MTETAETKRIVKDIKLYDPDAFVYKVHGSAYGKSGIPDLYVCINGESLWVEVKVYPNKPTALQGQAMFDIINAGGIAMVMGVRELNPGRLWQMVVSLWHPHEGKFRRTFERARGEHWPFGWLVQIDWELRTDRAAGLWQPMA